MDLESTYSITLWGIMLARLWIYLRIVSTIFNQSVCLYWEYVTKRQLCSEEWEGGHSPCWDHNRPDHLCSIRRHYEGILRYSRHQCVQSEESQHKYHDHCFCSQTSPEDNQSYHRQVSQGTTFLLTVLVCDWLLIGMCTIVSGTSNSECVVDSVLLSLWGNSFNQENMLILIID